jgi:hypothetical protein
MSPRRSAAAARSRTRPRRAAPRRRRSGVTAALARLGPRLARLPPLGWALVAVVVLVAANWVVQVVKKPTELFALVRAPKALAPEQTWARYGALCRENATPVVRAEVLAALIQIESAGDPLARTYWRFRPSWNPFEVYAPASSAVGMLQITDGTFDEARRYCIHDHAVARDGAWYDPTTCWFNALYFRTSPGDAIEMTAARLDVLVAGLSARRARPPSQSEVAGLVAVIHLCGRERGEAFVARGYRLAAGERCGDHAARAYVDRVRALAATFARLD